MLIKRSSRYGVVLMLSAILLVLRDFTPWVVRLVITGQPIPRLRPDGSAPTHLAPALATVTAKSSKRLWYRSRGCMRPPSQGGI